MTSKPTICVECEHHYWYQKIYGYYYGYSKKFSYCRLEDKTKINFVTGREDVIKRTECYEINTKGQCPDFKAKEQPPPPPPPPLPPPIREGPPIWVHADSYLGPECPICRSDMKRRWWIVGPLLGCINEDCRNYWKQNEMGPPRMPPPPPPKGQRPVPKE